MPYKQAEPETTRSRLLSVRQLYETAFDRANKISATACRSTARALQGRLAGQQRGTPPPSQPDPGSVARTCVRQQRGRGGRRPGSPAGPALCVSSGPGGAAAACGRTLGGSRSCSLHGSLVKRGQERRLKQGRRLRRP